MFVLSINRDITNEALEKGVVYFACEVALHASVPSSNPAPPAGLICLREVPQSAVSRFVNSHLVVKSQLGFLTILCFASVASSRILTRRSCGLLA